MSGRRRSVTVPDMTEQEHAQAQGEQDAAIALAEEDRWQITGGGTLTVLSWRGSAVLPSCPLVLSFCGNLYVSALTRGPGPSCISLSHPIT